MFERFFSRKKALTSVSSGRPGWWWSPHVIKEPFAGAWQQNQEICREDLTANHAVFACMTQIASDNAKMAFRLGRTDDRGIWQRIPASDSSRFVATLTKKPNPYQNWGQFIEYWQLSKQSRGNTYAYKDRDSSGNVQALHVLDPQRVWPLVGERGDVYYQIGGEKLTTPDFVDVDHVVPASEILHDRFNCLFHPLCGISPLYAAALPALQGLNIQKNSITHFGNNSMPGGVLTAPGQISEAQIARLRETWESTHGGPRAGRLAVLGDGMQYTPIAMTASDSQLVEQLEWTARQVCSVFHVPPWLIGIGEEPSGNDVSARTMRYYVQCLQSLLIAIQRVMDNGLPIGRSESYQFDTHSLMMMDPSAQMTFLEHGVKAALISPNEGRERLNFPPKEGGDDVYLQQQNWSLGALARRDNATAPAATSTPTPSEDESLSETEQRALVLMLEKELNS